MRCNFDTATMKLVKKTKAKDGIYTIRHYVCPICGHEESYYSSTMTSKVFSKRNLDEPGEETGA